MMGHIDPESLAGASSWSGQDPVAETLESLAASAPAESLADSDEPAASHPAVPPEAALPRLTRLLAALDQAAARMQEAPDPDASSESAKTVLAAEPSSGVSVR